MYHQLFNLVRILFIRLSLILIFLAVVQHWSVCYAQQSQMQEVSQKIERGYKKNNRDTLASGYFDLGEMYYQKGEVSKSESFYKKAKDLYEKAGDAEGIAKTSRALAKAQEDLNKNKEAIGNYQTAIDNNVKTGDVRNNYFNANDINRLKNTDDKVVSQTKLVQLNLVQSLADKDTNEIVTNFSRMGDLSFKQKLNTTAINAWNNAFKYSIKTPGKALQYNQLITNAYLVDSNYPKAIETKKALLRQDFVEKSTQLKAKEMASLADIYILKRDDTAAIRLLRESYALSLRNGHTMQAKECIEKLDSIFRATGKKQLSLDLYKSFLAQLPGVIQKDSSLVDSKIIALTESRIRELETEKGLKDDLLRRRKNFNYWLIGSILVLFAFITAILFMLRKLRTKNKKIALQSLRREMNPHFIFNSLNSINQFIATNNELAANQYLTKFSTLMRGVMENSKDDFILFSKEYELLRNYLDLEKSRFTDKFDYTIHVSDALQSQEELYIPGMLVQPHLENAIWHGLRYIDGKGMLKLSFDKAEQGISITIEDNGIGIAASKQHKTSNQRQHAGRGILNTQERINILNELYGTRISCQVEDKPAPGHGVIVRMVIPGLKKQNK